MAFREECVPPEVLDYCRRQVLRMVWKIKADLTLDIHLLLLLDEVHVCFSLVQVMGRMFFDFLKEGSDN